MRRISAAFELGKISGGLAFVLAALAGGADLCAAGSLHAFVSHRLPEKAGAVIVSDPQTGRILALCNPQSAFKEAYPPGSTAKLVVGAAAPEDPLASSEHFELVYPSSQEPWVRQTLDTLEQWRKELGEHAEILPSRVRVETWAAVGEFIRATGQPGWIAATSDGQSIALQPLDLLARKRILSQTLRHELTHLAVHRLRAKGVPRWFEEGLVLYATGERIKVPTAALMTSRELEEAVTKPRSEADMKAAYAQALERVRQLARQRGEPELCRMLQHPEDFR
jgi:hypothetical protein